jgi:hypothetical protein
MDSAIVMWWLLARREMTVYGAHEGLERRRQNSVPSSQQAERARPGIVGE